jgi:DNA (cytosine-5)-methyltransferase 1
MLTTIRILKPSFVVGENVAGLVSMDNGKTLERILSDLENEGYQTESFIIPACSIGAWHRRDRIWIVCYRGQTYSNPRCSERGRDNKSQERQQYTSGWESFGKSDALYNTLCYTKYSGGCNGRELKARTGQLKSELGRMVNGIPLELDGYWNREPDGIPRVATGVKNRVDRLKGLGNAIVPQVAFQIFKAIEAVNNFVENNTYR